MLQPVRIKSLEDGFNLVQLTILCYIQTQVYACKKMQLAIAISVILSVLVLHQVNGHVRLVFPPARQPNYDFLDNVRTGGPCGVPGMQVAVL